MSQLSIIRHAQASLMKADYDQLSDLGHLQAKKLAAYLVEQDIHFDKIYWGTLKRHRQTASYIQNAYDRQSWSYESKELAAFNEHQSPKVARWILERVLSDETSEQLDYYRSLLPEADLNFPKKQYLALFDLVSVAWAKGAIDASPIGIAPFSVFRRGVEKGIQSVVDASKRKEHIAIITSGGPTSVSVGKALQLSDEKTMELNGIIRNSAITNFLFNENRFSLHQFNTTPHLQTSDLLTYV
ncbi:MAG: histidine phosphatase family protein [Bacteroidota bacterium]